MCWTTIRKDLSQPKKVTDKNGLEVFKICKKSYYNDDILPYFYDKMKPYKKGCEYFTIMDDIKAISICRTFNPFVEYQINNGFHSYSKGCTTCFKIDNDYSHLYVYSKDRQPLEHYDIYNNILYRVVCIIPYGATYYENWYGEIVSDKLIPMKFTKISTTLSRKLKKSLISN